MTRNVVLGCLPCPCVSSEAHDAPLPSNDLHVSTSAGNYSSAEEVPSFKLVPLPRQRAYPHHAVGIDDQVKRVIELLEWENETKEAVAVILHSLGGTGKTTVADAVVARLDIEGWNCSTAVPQLENTGSNTIRNFEDSQREMQLGKPGFIWIDNVIVPGEDLHKLILRNQSSKKLRLLLTARDESVADVLRDCGIQTHVYPVRPLLSQDAMELLCNKMGVPAGTIQIPPDHHMSQINEILKICDGVPLVVERVGAYICQSQDKAEAYRRVIEWSKGGEHFSTAEEYNIEKNGLLFDFDKLPASEKEPFLDICCFFNGQDWDQVSCIMGEDALNNLRKRALLLNKEDCENKVMVRHIILPIARNMTKDKRFTNVHDLSKALEGNELDIAGIKGIWLRDNISEPFLISAKKLDLMHESLRVLALGGMAIVVGMEGQYCTKRFQQIIYFQAGPIPSIPFHPATSKEMTILDWLPHNNNHLQLNKMSLQLKVLNLNGVRYHRRVETEGVFRRLWRLRTLKLAEFKKLNNLSEDLCSLTPLQELDVSGCRNLVQLPKGLGELNALVKLNLRSCGSLQELPDSFGKLRSLKYLDLHSCVTLKLLPQDFGSLTSLEHLDLGFCSNLKDLPSSFGNLSSLKVLNLLQCGSLRRLPDNIGNLSALVEVKLEGWLLLNAPRSFQQLSRLLVSVSMKGCSYFQYLPEEVCGYLKLVKDLSFERCGLLRKLPNNLMELASLRLLNLSFCRSLENLPEGFGQLKSLVQLDLSGCESLRQLSNDFHCLASLQVLRMQWCTNLEGKSMDSVVNIRTLVIVCIEGSEMLVKRWVEMQTEKQGESWHFAVGIELSLQASVVGDSRYIKLTEVWANKENMMEKLTSKLFMTENFLLTDCRGQPFSLSTVAPRTVLLVMYQHGKDSRPGPVWKLLEEIVKHEHPLPFQMIYSGKYFGQLSENFADRIMAYADEFDARLLLSEMLLATYQFDTLIESGSSASLIKVSDFFVTEVVADEEGRKHLSTWKHITGSCVDFLLSKSTLYSHLKKLTETPQESNVNLLRELFDSAEARTSSIFVRNYTEHIGVDGFHGKTVLLFVSVMDQHPFQSLIQVYSKVKANDDMEIISIPIPAKVRGGLQERGGDEVVGLQDSDLAGFEIILRSVPWPVLRNPWLLKTQVFYFIEREWSELNPAILVVVEPNGAIRNKNALPLVEKWGAEVYPFTEQKTKELELRDQEPPEEQLSEYILNALLQK